MSLVVFQFSVNSQAHLRVGFVIFCTIVPAMCCARPCGHIPAIPRCRCEVSAHLTPEALSLEEINPTYQQLWGRWDANSRHEHKSSMLLDFCRHLLDNCSFPDFRPEAESDALLD